MTPDEYREYMRLYMKRRYDERMSAAIKYLGGECVDCFATEDLEIDHIDPSTKSFTLSSKTTLSWKRFVVELDKCQLLCVACHQIKTSLERSVEHGGGVSGKKNCLCDLCRPLKNKHSRDWKRRRRSQHGGMVQSGPRLLALTHET